MSDAGASTANTAEWYAACSKGGTLEYVYGNVYSSIACNMDLYGSSTVTPVDVPASCEGGYPSLMGMNGNATEWENGCNAAAGMNDSCNARGGNFLSDDTSDPPGNCPGTAVYPRSYRSQGLGFRCCRDGN